MSLKSQLSDIFNERTNYDFVGPRRKYYAVSLLCILIGVAAFFARDGLNLGIDFKGGTAWQFKMAKGSASTQAIRDRMESAGVKDAKVVILNSNAARVQAARADKTEQEAVAKKLGDYAQIKPADVSISDVGPTWGHQVSRKAIRALFFFFIAIAVYLSLRFEWKMALAAIIAVIHDILITVGAYAVTQFEVTPATVIAFLTILGFSLYDTVVVFDKVKENTDGLSATSRQTYSDVVNRSMNQVLMRSLNTSFVAVLPVFSLLVVGSYVFGALTIKDFALALFIGLCTGAYSSIFVATPILAGMKEHEPRYQALRARVAAGVPVAPKAGRSVPVFATGPKSDGPVEDARALDARPSDGRPSDGRPSEAEPASARPKASSRPDGDEPAGVGAGPAARTPPPVKRPPPRPRKKGRRR